jgi:hypothetical protein
MNLRGLVTLVFVFVSALIFSGGFVNSGTNASNYGFDVSITPEVGKQGVFQAKFEISELGSGRIVASPTIRFRAGDPAEATSGDPKHGVNFKFSVSVDEKTSVAEYSAVVLESNTEISRSQAKISLSN